MKENLFDLSVVGGGIVGLATAYKLQLKYPKINIVVLEKEKELAFHQTGRNSGVIHSGLYYKPGTHRANNCVDGRIQLVNFAKEQSIRYDVCGKIVLAVNKNEANALKMLKDNGEKNGLKGLKILTPKEFKEIEPYADGIAALWVPESGIIDYRQVTNKFAELILKINPKSKIICSCEVLDLSLIHI